MLSYSDGEVAGAGMGFALWMPDGKCIGGCMKKLPEEVLTVWSLQATAGDHYDIFEIEAVGSAIIIRSWLRNFNPGALL